MMHPPNKPNSVETCCWNHTNQGEPANEQIHRNIQTHTHTSPHSSTIDELRKIMLWKPAVSTQPMTFTFTTAELSSPSEKRKINEVHFFPRVDNIPLHGVVAVAFFSLLLSSFHQFVLFATFSWRIFLVIYFPFPISTKFSVFFVLFSFVAVALNSYGEFLPRERKRQLSGVLVWFRLSVFLSCKTPKNWTIM